MPGGRAANAYILTEPRNMQRGASLQTSARLRGRVGRRQCRTERRHPEKTYREDTTSLPRAPPRRRGKTPATSFGNLVCRPSCYRAACRRLPHSRMHTVRADSLDWIRHRGGSAYGIPPNPLSGGYCGGRLPATATQVAPPEPIVCRELGEPWAPGI